MSDPTQPSPLLAQSTHHPHPRASHPLDSSTTESLQTSSERSSFSIFMSALPAELVPNGHSQPPSGPEDGLNGLTRKRGLSRSEAPAQVNGNTPAPIAPALSPSLGLGGGLPQPPPALPRSVAGRNQQQGVNLAQRNWQSWSLVNEGHVLAQQADTLFEL